MALTTNLNRIRSHDPCRIGWKKLLAGLGKTEADDEPLSYAKIVEAHSFDAGLLASHVEPRYAKKWRLFAIWCARQVEHLMTDPRSKAALVVAERFANGDATQKELFAAWVAASVAAESSESPGACYAAMAARDSAKRDAAFAARYSALHAMDAAECADEDDAKAARRAKAAQKAKFLELVGS